MFSSNQILKISGNLSDFNNEEIYNALEFALKLSRNLENFTRKNEPSKCVYQITQSGKYCIGWAYNDVKDGWNEFPFDFDLNIISLIIAKHLKNQKVNRDIWDGSYSKGFIMKAIPETLSDEYEGIKNPFYGIIEFSPYTCFYSK